MRPRKPKDTSDQNTPDFDAADDKPSKSEKKREMQALQEVGEAIIKLSDGEFATIPLEGELLTAIALARRLKSGEGLRRQMQYVGKLMRHADTTAIQAALQDLQNGRALHNQRFHQLEQLRDILLTEGVSAMDKVLEPYPNADRQHLRQLITTAVKEREQEKPPAAARKLFKYLRELAEI
ncbi:MAG: ribosome biogenesis factor YjgA [Spongiibacteraceae bacterium]